MSFDPGPYTDMFPTHGFEWISTLNELLCIIISLCICVCCNVDLTLLGPVGLPGEQAAIARTLKPSHLSAKEGL